MAAPAPIPEPIARPPRPEVAALAAAYDAIAPDYDRLVAEDAWMRRVLWTHYDRLFGAGDRVLDLCCGTGLDSLYLAARGVEVTARDVSPGMIDRLQAKLTTSPYRLRVECQIGEAAALDGWPRHRFDGVVTAFAGLNTAGAPRQLAATLHRVLRPGGRLIAHLLTPAGLWERLETWRDDGWRAASALARRRIRPATIGARAVAHRVLPPVEAYRPFASRFRLRGRYGLGFLWPRAASGRIPPAAARVLGALERRLGAWPPFRGWGRFVVLDLEARR